MISSPLERAGRALTRTGGAFGGAVRVLAEAGRALRDRGRMARQRRHWVAHLCRAARRYHDTDAERLAAALAYYAFFAAFAMAGLGFAVLGWVLRGDVAAHVAQRWVDQNVPWMDTAALTQASTRIGVIAMVALVVAGRAWVAGVRSAVRTVWLLEEEPGNFWVRLLTDLLLLVGLGVLLLASVATTAGVSTLIRWLVADAAGVGSGVTERLLTAVGFLLGIAVNTVLAATLLTALPRVKTPIRRILGPALVVAAGLEVLKTVGQLYLERSEPNPAYRAVASAVGLLLFLYLLNQVLLFAAALAATSEYGEATDVAEGGVVVGSVPGSESGANPRV